MLLAVTDFAMWFLGPEGRTLQRISWRICVTDFETLWAWRKTDKTTAGGDKSTSTIKIHAVQLKCAALCRNPCSPVGSELGILQTLWFWKRGTLWFLFLGPCPWQNGFFADFYFRAAGFFCGVRCWIFSPHFCGKKSAQKNAPGKSSAESSQSHVCRLAGAIIPRLRFLLRFFCETCSKTCDLHLSATGRPSCRGPSSTR